MSNLLRKVTAAATALTMTMSIVAPVVGVQAADDSTAAANRLAALGVIVDNSKDPSKYNLGSNITRREMLKVMMNLSSVEVGETCEWKFADLPKSDWGCKYAEAALKAGFIAANKNFRPNDMVTEAEALKMVMQAKGIAKKDGVANWADAYAQAAVDAGILATAKVSTSAAKRSFVITSADKVVSTSSTDTATDSSDDNLDDLLGDLLGGDNGTSMSGSTTSSGNTNTTTGTVTTPVASGDLDISLSPATPSKADLPAGAEGVAVAKFDVTAGSSDVSVTSVKLARKGLGASASVSDVALFANGTRVSKAKTFNASDDTADVVLSPALVVKAGSTVTLTAKVTTTSTAGTFAVELVWLTSTAANVKGGNVVASSFEVKATPTAKEVQINNDGSVTAPKLGAKQAELLKFQVKNVSSNNEDVTLQEITFKEDGGIDETTELANVTLYNDGKEVAKVASMSSKYVTFNLVTPITIKDGNNAKFVVKADIVGGAGDSIKFILDNDLDVTASASKYGYTKVSDNLTDADHSVTVQAGEVTLVQVDPTSTEIRKDKDDIVFGTLKIVSKAGKTLELEKIRVTLANSAVGGANISTILDNVELFDVNTKTVYDLGNAAAAGTTETYDEDVNITVPSSGELVLAIRADTLDVASAETAKITASVAYDTTVTTTAGNFAIKETADDKYVTDVTPSSITFKTVNGTASSATVTSIVLSDTNSVIGSKGVKVAEFQVSASDSSALKFTEAKAHLAVATLADAKAKTQTITFGSVANDGDRLVIDGITYEFDWNSSVTESSTLKAVALGVSANASASNLQAKISSTLATASVSTNVVTVTNRTKWDTPTAVADITNTVDADNDIALAITQASVGTKATSAQVAAVYLMKGTTVLDQVSGSQLADGVATFDGFTETIAKNGKVNYDVLVDLIDDTNQSTKRLAASITSVDLEDEDADDITASGLPAVSARDVTIKGVGTLVIAVDNTDTETDKVKNVLANTTSPFVASFEMTATNEAIKVKDLEVVAAGDTTNFVNSVSEVVLYKNDKVTEIDREPVTSTTVTFDNVNYVVAEGNSNVYVKVVTRKIGKDSAWVQTSDITLALNATDVEGNASGKVVQDGVSGSDLTWAASNAFAVVPVKVSAVSFVSSFGGETVATSLTNGENTVWIIAVTTDSSSNTKDDGTSLKTELESIKATVNTDAAFDGLNDTAGADFRNVTVKKINWVTSATAVTKQADGSTALVEDAVPTAMNLIKWVDLGADEELENGTTTYYVVKATFSGLSSTTNKYFQLKLDNLDSASTVEYSSNNSDDASDSSTVYADNVSSLRIGTTSVTWPSISSNY